MCVCVKTINLWFNVLKFTLQKAKRERLIMEHSQITQKSLEDESAAMKRGRIVEDIARENHVQDEINFEKFLENHILSVEISNSNSIENKEFIQTLQKEKQEADKLFLDERKKSLLGLL